ncbi:cytochrome P450 [Aspergillus lucknowensis]|uniref:Cytochrome P450 n=1 Tax=Aspergillus lucknowensis TaxID=176173 RepID=A0ABR4LIF3_9EURO
MWLSLASGLILLYSFDYFRRLYKNIRIAQRSKLPYFVVPFTFGIIPTILLQTGWVLYIIDNWLPEWLGNNLKDVVPNCRWMLKDRQVKRYGKVYLVVTPKVVMCNVSDAEVVSHITNNRGSFLKPIWQYQVIELYGPNVVTCEADQWARHRRQTANIFNEKNNELVWREGISLVNGMIEHWRSLSQVDATHGFVVRTIRDDMMKFALSLFSVAGFGVRMPFKPVNRGSAELEGPYGAFQDTTTPPKGFDFTFRSVTAYMNVNISTVVFANLILPKWVPRGLLPFLKWDFAAYRDLRTYLERLLSIAEAQDTTTASNLIQGMLRDRSLSKEGSLSDLEIISNAHIFTIAGHETTASTLQYALLSLALHPDVQEWVYEGIIEATRGEPVNVAHWNYASVYPRLVTSLCVMLETMRLYPPIVTVPKWTGNTARTVRYQGRDLVLEPGVNISLNMNGLHYSEEYWGPDAGTFSPQRWDKNNKESFLARNDNLPGLNAAGLEYPTIHKPVRGAYVPFSDGIRACLGKKFAQVEVVIALTVILRRYRVELIRKDNEGRMFAEKALEGSYSVIALAMKEDVPLVFQERCQ